ncbi:hypothetical protein A1QY_13845 [Vibrio anguillarum]|nr:hypothetical protein A1QY_13845 [Vibrio anguillarum]
MLCGDFVLRCSLLSLALNARGGMNIEISNDIIGAAAFFAILVYPEQTERSFEKRNQLIDSIMYLGVRQDGYKPVDMAGYKGFACEDFSKVTLRRFETRLETANKILVDKVFQAVSWIQMHSLTGTEMCVLWDRWKDYGVDVRERARKEVFSPFKPVLHLAFSFATVGIGLLDKNSIALDIISACRGYSHWLKDVVEDSGAKLTLFEVNPSMQGRRLFDRRLRVVSEKSLMLNLSSVEIPPTRK